MIFFKDNKAVAQYVEDILLRLRQDLPLTMIILPDTSGGFYVSPVTGELSEDTVKMSEPNSFSRRTSTS